MTWEPTADGGSFTVNIFNYNNNMHITCNDADGELANNLDNTGHTTLDRYLRVHT